MALHRTALLLPCHSLEDFPTYLLGEEASGILAAWTALWHPALLATTGSLPEWYRADDPPDPLALEGTLVLIPSVSHAMLPEGWCDQLRATSPRNYPPLERLETRSQMVAAALDATGLNSDSIDAALAQDFLALGFAYLQVKLLTHAMQHSGFMEEIAFRDVVVQAARKAVAGDKEGAETGITQAVDMLTQARSHYYPVDFYLVDVTLLSPTTLGRPLQEELALGYPTSLLTTGALMNQIAEAHPEILEAFQRCFNAKTASIVGGMMHDEALGGLAPEAILEQLTQGQKIYQQHLGCDVSIFAQTSASFSPLLPQILKGCGYQGALHAAFDGGRLPKTSSRQCRTWWSGTEGASIDTLATLPLDTGQPETMLTLASKISDSMDHDQIATLLLAGWPGHRCESYDDLRRISRFGPVLGQFVTLEQYFEVPMLLDQQSTFCTDAYPLNSGLLNTDEAIASQIEPCRRQVAEVHKRLLAGLTDGIAGDWKNEGQENGKPLGVLAINPWNFPCPAYQEEEAEEPWYLPHVPGCGFAWSDSSVEPPPIPLADGNRLCNEHLEVVVSPKTGGIQALHSHHHRGNRASQRLVFFDQARQDGNTPFSTMVADSVQITRNDFVAGAITSQGKLLDPDRHVLAHYTQTVQLLRASRTVRVDVELRFEPSQEGQSELSYFASRLAWRHEESTLRRGVGWTARPAPGVRLTSPEWIEITDSQGPITLFAMGLPQHRRIASTQLDTQLAPQKSQFSLGLDCLYPAQTAVSLFTPASLAVSPPHNRPPTTDGWFFHLGAKNMVLTHLEPIEERKIRLRILETEGRAVQTKLAAFRPFQVASRTDYLGQVLESLPVEAGQVILRVGPHEWLQLEVEW